VKNTYLLVRIEVLESDDRSHVWVQGTWVQPELFAPVFRASFAAVLVSVILIETFSRNY
jgi:hypothetical protein